MRRIYTHSNEFHLQKMRHFEEILFLTCVCVCVHAYLVDGFSLVLLTFRIVEIFHSIDVQC